MVFIAVRALADSPQITLPAPASETGEVRQSTAAAEPISTEMFDPNDKNWKEYDNRIVKVHARVKSAWTVIEIKETNESGSVTFRLSRLPFATFSVTREPMTGSFEEYVSSPTLTSIYPSGYKQSRQRLAGRQAVRVKGIGSDGRMDESYFVADHGFYSQVSFSAPEDSWNTFNPSFAALKESFRWLP